jgi:DnaJ domain
VNHYERLKVSPEAPQEVIRAAYRALATKLHPDRQGGDAGPTEEAHEAMAALNASYLVLTNAKARAAYDAQLKAGQTGAYSTGAFQTSEFQPSAFHTEGGGPHTAGGGPTSRMGNTTADPAWHDISWLKGGKAPPHGKGDAAPAAKGLPNWAWALLASSLVTAAVMGWMVWNEGKRLNFDRTLSRAAIPGDVAGSGAQDGTDLRRKSGQIMGAGALPEGLDPEVVKQIEQAAGETGQATPTAPPDISAEELDRLSNEELLARVPELMAEGTDKANAALLGKPAATPQVTAPKATTTAAATPTAPTAPNYSWQQGRHHLDSGQPLQLKLAPSTRLTMPSAKP